MMVENLWPQMKQVGKLVWSIITPVLLSICTTSLQSDVSVFSVELTNNNWENMQLIIKCTCKG